MELVPFTKQETVNEFIEGLLRADRAKDYSETDKKRSYEQHETGKIAEVQVADTVNFHAPNLKATVDFTIGQDARPDIHLANGWSIEVKSVSTFNGFNSWMFQMGSRRCQIKRFKGYVKKGNVLIALVNRDELVCLLGPGEVLKLMRAPELERLRRVKKVVHEADLPLSRWKEQKEKFIAWLHSENEKFG